MVKHKTSVTLILCLAGLSAAGYAVVQGNLRSAGVCVFTVFVLLFVSGVPRIAPWGHD
jgi:hypothetical protein